MPLDLPTGTSCFVDANIFYYHFVETPPFSDLSSDFLRRIASGDLTAYTSSAVLAEAIHKVMVAEAASRFNLQRANLVNWLVQHRERIKQLSEFRAAIEELSALPLVLMPVESRDLLQAAILAQQNGLLTNDALSVALMRTNSLTHLITNDDDFDLLSELTIWKPR